MYLNLKQLSFIFFDEQIMCKLMRCIYFVFKMTHNLALKDHASSKRLIPDCHFIANWKRYRHLLFRKEVLQYASIKRGRPDCRVWQFPTRSRDLGQSIECLSVHMTSELAFVMFSVPYYGLGLKADLHQQ